MELRALFLLGKLKLTSHLVSCTVRRIWITLLLNICRTKITIWIIISKIKTHVLKYVYKGKLSLWKIVSELNMKVTYKNRITL